MRKMLIVLIAIVALWFVISRMNTAPRQPDNAATQYADNLKRSEEKAVASVAAANLVIARTALLRFKGSEGRLPRSAEEMVELKYLDRVPEYVKYDPQTGSFEKDIR